MARAINSITATYRERERESERVKHSSTHRVSLRLRRVPRMRAYVDEAGKEDAEQEREGHGDAAQVKRVHPKKEKKKQWHRQEKQRRLGLPRVLWHARLHAARASE
jgi:hypothetical protein